MFTGVPLLDDLARRRDLASRSAPSGRRRLGEAWPSVSFLSRSALSASEAVFLVMSGTLTLPLPTATRIATGVPFSTSSPAAGVCLRTVPGGALSSTCCLLVGVELEVGRGQLLLGRERRLLADDLGHDDVLRHRLRNSRNSSRSSSSSTRDQPPRQPRLLAEHALGRQQRRGRRRRAAAAGQLDAALGQLGRVERLHLRPLHLRRAELRHAHVDAARPDLDVRRVELRLEHARPVDARDLRLARAPLPPLLLGLRLRLREHVGAQRLGGGARGRLLARDGLDLQPALLRAADPDLLRRARPASASSPTRPRGSPAAAG